MDNGWEDLSLRKPGQMARAQADSQWATRKAEKPVRAVLGRLLNAHTDERAWRVGADGEEAIGARLDALSKRGWRTLHSVPVGSRGSDIDHVVIGPGGVFTVNSKRHPGAKVWVGGNTVMVNGQRVPYVRNSRHEAERTSRLLTAACGFEVTVSGLIAVAGVSEFTIKKQPDDVLVVGPRGLTRTLRAAKAVWDAEQVERVWAIAKRSTIWSLRY